MRTKRQILIARMRVLRAERRRAAIEAANAEVNRRILEYYRRSSEIQRELAAKRPVFVARPSPPRPWWRIW